MAGMEITHVLSSMDFQLPRLTVVCPSAAAETNTASSRWPHSLWWVIAHLPSGRLITLDHCHLGRGNLLLLLEHTLTLDMDLQTHHLLDLENASFTIVAFHTALLLTEESSSLQRKCCNELMFMEFNCLTMFPIVLKQLACQDGGGFWKTQLLCQLGGNTFQDRGNVLQEVACTANQYPVHGGFSPIVRTLSPGIQEVEMRVVSPTIIPSDSLAKFLLSVPMTLSYDGLEIIPCDYSQQRITPTQSQPRPFKNEVLGHLTRQRITTLSACWGQKEYLLASKQV